MKLQLKPKISKILFFTIFSVLVNISASAQSGQMTVTGTVKDNQNQPVAFATVIEMGANNGTITGENGEYTITVSKNATLVFSYLGYKEQEVLVEGKSLINIALELDASLDEIVIVGYGTQKKENLTGSVVAITSEIIEDRGLTSASVALQGTVAGVFINQNSGQAGRDDVQIRIRGIGTLNNAAPLVLVDGIDTPIDEVSPSDIASITVLKDAAAAAIYGSRAANGVVLVTTKVGKKGAKPRLSYSSYTGVTQATRLPNMVTNSLQFATLRNEANTNFGNPEVFGQNSLDYFRDNGPNTDWFDVIFDSAMIQQHDFSISGGGNNSSYRISFGLLKQDGVTPESGFNRFNTRINFSTDLSDKFSIKTGLAITRGNRFSSQENLAGPGSELYDAAEATPLFPAYDDMGRIAIANPDISGASLGNPLASIEGSEFNQINYALLGNVTLDYEPIEGLVFSLQGAANYRNFNDELFLPSYFVYDFITGEEFIRNPLRERSRTYQTSFNTTVSFRANYEKTFGKHYIKGLAGYSEEESDSEIFGASRNGFLTNTIRILSVGDPTSATNFEGGTTWGIQSYFGRLNYVFDEKYLFEANVRTDGTSRFANDKWGIFPSFSAGWLVSKENFFPKSGVLNFLKLRASWGQLGNQIANPNDDFIYARQLSLSETYNFGGSVVPGVAQTTLGNPDLTWETTTVTNLAFEMGLWNSSLKLTAEYFIRDTEDILFTVPVSSLTGFSNVIANSANIENKGWELGLNYRKNFGDFRLSFDGNVTHVTSDVVMLNPNIETGSEDRFIYGIDGRRILERGSPVNSFYGVEVAGIFQSQEEIDSAPDHSFLNPNFGPGDLRFVDQNNDGVINQEDRTLIGKEDPTWLFGANINMSYKNLDLSVIISGAADFDSYSTAEIARPFFSNASLEKRWVNRWTPTNTETNIPRLFFTDGPATSINNAFWILDRSYVRLKNVQLGYTLPTSMLDKTFISKFRVYLSGSNLITWTKFPYFDPERPKSNTEDRGQDGFPNLSVVAIGLNLSF
jgi:TonB-linked SusC/RagA family outer membrane protein